MARMMTSDTLEASLAHVKAQLVDLQVDAAAHVEFRPDRHVLEIRSDSSTAIPRVLQAEHPSARASSSCESIIAKLKGDFKMADLQVGERDEKVRDLAVVLLLQGQQLDTAAPAAAIQPDANKAATMSSVQKTLEVKR